MARPGPGTDARERDGRRRADERIGCHGRPAGPAGTCSAEPPDAGRTRTASERLRWTAGRRSLPYASTVARTHRLARLPPVALGNHVTSSDTGTKGASMAPDESETDEHRQPGPGSTAQGGPKSIGDQGGTAEAIRRRRSESGRSGSSARARKRTHPRPISRIPASRPAPAPLAAATERRLATGSREGGGGHPRTSALERAKNWREAPRLA